MSSASDLQAEVETRRDDRERVQTDANRAAAVLADLDAALDRLQRGALPTGPDRTVAGLVADVRPAFERIERDEFSFLLTDIQAAYDDYRPAAATEAAETLRRAYEETDDGELEAGIGTLLELFEGFNAPELDERLERLRDAYDRRDDGAFRTAVEAVVELYAEVHMAGVVELTADFERLFGHTYESAAATHVSDLETAFESQDAEAFDSARSALETAFENNHADAIARRESELQAGLENAQPGRVESHVEAFRADARAARRRTRQLTDRLNDALGALVQSYPADPSQPLSALADPLQPVVMLPVQLETRFTDIDSQGNCRLQIRVYPDDIHVDTHEPELTDDEVTAGRAFWERVWWAAYGVPTSNLAAALAEDGRADLVTNVDLNDLPEASADRHAAVLERAWADLVERVGQSRAGYVKRALAPSTSADLLEGAAESGSPAAVDFDALDDDVVRSPGAWTRQPTAELLPDRWVAFVDTGSRTLTATSSHVREPLPIGPDPDVVGTGGTGPTWMMDFEAAKQVGMGLELELDGSTATSGLASVTVVGVKASMDADATATALRSLLDGHHYTEGLELLPQGTPTNNTGDGRTPRSARTDPAGSRPIECGPPLATEGTDGATLARLLGLDPDQLGGGPHVFGHVAGADDTEQQDARHAQDALWSATWGYFIPHMLAPADAAGSAGGADYSELAAWLAAYREHFVEYVRARGPAPALRVGDQAYGVLPATVTADWQPLSLSGTGGSGGSGGSNGFTPQTYGDRAVLPDLVEAVRTLRSAWNGSVGSVRTLSDVTGASDPVAALLEVLGREPRSVGYRYREGFGRQTLLWALTGHPPPYPNVGSGNFVQSMINNVQSGPGAQLIEQAFGGSMPDARVTEALFWARESDPLGPLVGTDTDAYLRKLLELPFDAIAVGDPARTEAAATERESPLDTLQTREGIRPEGRADSLLEVLLYYATLEEYAAARVRLGDLYGPGGVPTTLGQATSGSAWHLVPEPELYDIGDDTVFDRLRDPLPAALDSHPGTEDGDRYVDALNRARRPEVTSPPLDPQFESFTVSLRYLLERDLGDPAMERLLTETLDLASYRFDAWTTSIATRRLDTLRSHQADPDTASSAGAYVGGVGWVTDLAKRPDDPDSDGYVHAPSLAQSTTAAVLRNGSTAFEGDRAEMLSLELSPDRVSNAVELIEGVRQGREFGALLGYRFERSLRDSPVPVDEYVREFRALEPAVADSMDRGQDGDSETAATRDVVDGLALYRRFHGDGDPIPWGSTVPASTSSVTLPDRYDVVDDLEHPEDADCTADLPPDATQEDRQYCAIVQALAGIGDLLDATSDLLTAESVHQVLNGKPTRAGASLDALSRGEAPPELEVVDTPRSGAALTHRLLVLFGDSPATTGWPSAPWQIRPDAEPYLDGWVADLLPAPSTAACVCAWEVTDDQGAVVQSDQVGVRLSELSIAPLDVLAVTEGGADAQRSELEQRVLYYVDRTRGIPDGAEVELLFGPVADWPYSASELGLGSLDGLVGVGQVLAVAGALQDVIGTGRPVAAEDLRQPGDATDSGLDGAALQQRAGAVLPALQAVADDLDEALTVLEADTQGNVPLTGVTDAAAAIETIQLSGMELKSLAGRLEGLDPAAVAADLSTLEAAFGLGVLSLATVDGDVQVEAAAGQRIGGQVAAAQGTSVTITARSGGSTPLSKSKQTTVGADGTFGATFDFSGVSAPTGFEVEVRADGVLIAPTQPGQVVSSVSGSPTANQAIGPVVTPALDEFAAVARRVGTVAATVEPAHAAFDRTDLSALRNVEGSFDYGALSGAPDWDGSWPSNIDAMVDRLLSVAPLSLPGADQPDLTATAWQRAYEFARLLTEGSDLLAYPIGDRAELAMLIDDVTDPGTATIETAVAAATGTIAAELRELAPLAGGTVADAVDALRLGVLESVRDALLRAAGFGVGQSVPQSARGIDGDAQSTLTDQATAVAAEVGDRLEAAPSAGPDATAETQLDRLEAAFGEGFTVLPPFSPTNAGELANTLAPSHSDSLQGGDELAVETWFQRSARVRDLPDRLQRALGMAEGVGGPVTDAGLDAARFRVGQLPYRSDDAWVGLPDAFDGDPPGGRLSLVAHAATPLGGNAPNAGLFVDEWVETVPSDTETTGLAFQHDRPTNQPPQSVLVAAPPDRAGWSPARLRDVAEETLSLARMRTVDTARLQDLGHFLPALTYAHNTTRDGSGPDTISLDFESLEGN